MFIGSLSLRNLRNIREANLNLHKKSNIIIGENAAGKTTVLESLDILSRGKSFRTNKTENLIYHGENELYVGATVGENKTKLEIKKSKDKTKILINGQEEKKQSRLAEELAIQVIHPGSHNLIEGGPSERRSFLDWGLFHVEQNFKYEWAEYQKILKQRNEALKSGEKNEQIWMEKLANLGEHISFLRQKYLDRLESILQEMKTYLMPEVDLKFFYDCGWNPKKSLLEALNEKKQVDLERGYTSCGPQNADIKIYLNKKEVHRICSRGQQKIIANIMLLSQTRDFYEKKSYASIILVDDLSAELTLELQEKILERLFDTESQIILTALNDSVLGDILCEMGAGVFHVEHGEIIQ